LVINTEANLVDEYYSVFFIITQKKNYIKLEKWLADFDFVDIQTAVEQIDWEKVQVVEL
jgi:hypothetical protein